MGKHHTQVLALSGLGLITGLAGCAQEKEASASRPPMLQLGRIEDLPGCDSSGSRFSRALARALSDRGQAMVIGLSDTSGLAAGSGPQRHDRRGGNGGSPGGGMGGPPGGGGMDGGMGGGPRTGSGGPPNGDGRGTPPAAPQRYLVAASLALSRDSLPGTRTLETAPLPQADLAVRKLSVALKLVDQATGRATWKETLRSDTLISGTCPSRESLAALAHLAAKSVLGGIPVTNAD